MNVFGTWLFWFFFDDVDAWADTASFLLLSFRIIARRDSSELLLVITRNNVDYVSSKKKNIAFLSLALLLTKGLNLLILWGLKQLLEQLQFFSAWGGSHNLKVAQHSVKGVAYLAQRNSTSQSLPLCMGGEPSECLCSRALVKARLNGVLIKEPW